MTLLPSGQQVLALATAALVIGFVIELLRRRQLREKYAILWLFVGSVVGLLSVFPRLLTWAAGTADVEVPTNLLFFLAIVLLLSVAMHLSWESSRHEERTRVLAEEVALLRGELEDLKAIGEAKSGRETEMIVQWQPSK